MVPSPLVINAGDVGVSLWDSFSSSLQNLYRVKIGKEPLRASHTFLCKSPQKISEANGLFISEGDIYNSFTPKNKCWVFRNKNLTEEQKLRVVDYLTGAEENGGTYSILGILQFILNFFLRFVGTRLKFHAMPGSFCDVYAGKALLWVKAPWLANDKISLYSKSPSSVRSWLESPEGKQAGWERVFEWNGKEFI